MHDVWMRSAVVEAEMMDKAGEPSLKTNLLPLHLRCLSSEAFVFCDSIGAAHELVPLDQRVTCQQINPLGSQSNHQSAHCLLPTFQSPPWKPDLMMWNHMWCSTF